MKKPVLAIAAALLLLIIPLVVRADPPPPSASISGVVGYPQEHNLSCESRSATDLAAFWNVTFSEDEFFRRLPKSDNPYRGFLGDVDQPAGTMPPQGYGVYAGPIAATLRTFGLDAQAHYDYALAALQAEIAAGRPVVIWSTYDMQMPGIQEWTSTDGQTSVVVRWQHTFIATGYDEGGIYLIDAYDAQTKYFTYEAFQTAWAQLGNQAVTVQGPLTQPGPRTWQVGERTGEFTVNGRWTVTIE